VTRRRVRHPRDAHLAEQRQDRARVAALAAQPHRPLGAPDDDRLTDVAVAACVDVGLQQQPHKLAAAAL